MAIANNIRTILMALFVGFFVTACAGNTGGSGSSSGAARVSSSGGTSDSGVAYLKRNVADRIFFNTNTTGLNNAARATLLAQAEWLKQNGSIALRIEGHADERGTREYNLALGARRAGAVRDFLISQGVSANRLTTISFGKERPVSLCTEERCWTKNRRAVSVVR